MITDVIAFISICLTSYLLSTLWRSWPIRSCCGKRKKEKKKRKLSNYKREKRQRCILYRCMDVYMASLQRGEKKKKVGIDLMPYRDTGEMQPGRGEWGGGGSTSIVRWCCACLAFDIFCLLTLTFVLLSPYRVALVILDSLSYDFASKNMKRIVGFYISYSKKL